MIVMVKVLENSTIKLGKNTLHSEAVRTSIPFGYTIHSIQGSVNGKSMNSIKDTGIYYGYTMTDCPYNSISVFLVMAYSYDWVIQVQYSIEEVPRAWIRAFYSATTWSAWKQIT